MVSKKPSCTWYVSLPFNPLEPRLGKIDIKKLQFDGDYTNEFEVWLVFQALPWLRRQVWTLPRSEDRVKRLLVRAGVLQFESKRFFLEAKIGPRRDTLDIRAEDMGQAAGFSDPEIGRLSYTVIGKESTVPGAQFVRLTDQEFKLMHQAASFVKEVGFKRQPQVCFVIDVDSKLKQLNAEA